MKLHRSRSDRRKGATTVEFAFVAIPLFMFLFGIYEYARYVFTLQVLENAAREGARYAVVNTYDSDVEADTIAKVKAYMAGVDVAAMGNTTTITVYAAGADGGEVGGPRDAEFGTNIGVRITGAYDTFLPNLLLMPGTINMDVRALMNSEAN